MMPDNEQTPDHTSDAPQDEAQAQAQAQQILSQLAAATALIPQEVPEGEEAPPDDAIALPVIEQDGTQYVPVFTSAEAMVAAGADPEQAAQLTFAQLGAGWPSDELWMAVDPSTPEGLTLPPDVIRALPALVAD